MAHLKSETAPTLPYVEKVLFVPILSWRSNNMQIPLSLIMFGLITHCQKSPHKDRHWALFYNAYFGTSLSGWGGRCPLTLGTCSMAQGTGQGRMAWTTATLLGVLPMMLIFVALSYAGVHLSYRRRVRLSDRLSHAGIDLEIMTKLTIHHVV